MAERITGSHALSNTQTHTHVCTYVRTYLSEQWAVHGSCDGCGVCCDHTAGVGAVECAKFILGQELIGSDDKRRQKGPESSDERSASVVQVTLDEGKLDTDDLHQAVLVQVPGTHDLQGMRRGQTRSETTGHSCDHCD